MENPNINLKYRSVSVEHLSEMQEDIDRLRRAGQVSNHPTFKSYTDTKKFELPKSFPQAKSIIAVAVPRRLAYATFHHNGSSYDVMINPPYYDDGLTLESLEKATLQAIDLPDGYRIEFTRSIHLKLLAVRSGMGRYGRNNICYVDEFGSLIDLYAYFTDYEFSDNSWEPIRFLDECEGCTMCANLCPNGCITESNKVINVTKCLPLYNEIDGEFPEWMDPGAHHTMMGCLKCQYYCPANKEVMKVIDRFEDVTSQETAMLLSGGEDPVLINSLSGKIKMFEPSQYLQMRDRLARNLSAMISQKNYRLFGS